MSSIGKRFFKIAFCVVPGAAAAGMFRPNCGDHAWQQHAWRRLQEQEGSQRVGVVPEGWHPSAPIGKHHDSCARRRPDSPAPTALASQYEAQRRATAATRKIRAAVTSWMTPLLQQSKFMLNDRFDARVCVNALRQIWQQIKTVDVPLRSFGLKPLLQIFEKYQAPTKFGGSNKVKLTLSENQAALVMSFPDDIAYVRFRFIAGQNILMYSSPEGATSLEIKPENVGHAEYIDQCEVPLAQLKPALAKGTWGSREIILSTQGQHEARLIHHYVKKILQKLGD
jgi:hypothetical protein